MLAFLCAGTAAFSQSPATPQVDPDKPFQMPEKFSFTAPDLKGPAVNREFSLRSAPPRTVIVPRPAAPAPGLNSPQIDPKIIVRPPWKDGAKGQEVSRHLYPNLKFLPLRGSRPVR